MSVQRVANAPKRTLTKASPNTNNSFVYIRDRAIPNAAAKQHYSINLETSNLTEIAWITNTLGGTKLGTPLKLLLLNPFCVSNPFWTLPEKNAPTLS